MRPRSQEIAGSANPQQVSAAGTLMAWGLTTVVLLSGRTLGLLGDAARLGIDPELPETLQNAYERYLDQVLTTEPVAWHGQEQSVVVNVPPLTTLWLRPT